MKSIFKRSSSKNMLDSEETGSALRAAVAADKSFDEQDNDPQDEGTKCISRQFSQDGREIMHEGWGEKESGQKIFGHYNWKKRWFRLTQKGHLVLFSYYVKPTDANPKGEVMLTQEYTARELEMGEKSKPNCFALGPVTDSSALRTYYVSCASEDDKCEWIATLNCIIEGVPEKLIKRKTTYRARSKLARGRRQTYPPPELSSKGETFSYQKFKWRLEQWRHLCRAAKETKWRRTETKNGVTIARQTFTDADIAVIKVESVLNIPRQMVYEFLQRSLRSGGKFDFLFRGEKLLQKIEEFQTTTEVIKKDYDVPLPGMKKRDACLAKMWIPDFISQDGTSGLLVMSVIHPSAHATKEMERIFLDVTGMVLQDAVGQDGEIHTHVTAVIQIDLQHALQNMLRGAYKSGVLKKGIRNGFNYLSSCLMAYKEMLTL
eukprot:Seg5638.2 transcript_id=Seg5638.2/GoldUCD/mRNA.D3Y31 product=Cytohesin-2 protein_id=Seg5638.2/GoldUCD/D3Y31